MMQGMTRELCSPSAFFTQPNMDKVGEPRPTLAQLTFFLAKSFQASQVWIFFWVSGNYHVHLVIDNPPPARLVFHCNLVFRKNRPVTRWGNVKSGKTEWFLSFIVETRPVTSHCDSEEGCPSPIPLGMWHTPLQRFATTLVALRFFDPKQTIDIFLLLFFCPRSLCIRCEWKSISRQRSHEIGIWQN